MVTVSGILVYYRCNWDAEPTPGDMGLAWQKLKMGYTSK
jgi:hypothetical protein